MIFFTIGVYNSNEKDFFAKLTDNKIDTFCDIRQVRGVRGAKYSFVNSNKLQTKLDEIGLKYFHITGLAPTTELRAIQKKEDAKKGILQRSRTKVGNDFIKEYKKRILNKFDMQNFVEELKENSAENIVLFCVEENPEACHRSIVAAELKKLEHNIKHL